MPRVIETTVYKFDELSPKAQRVALDQACDRYVCGEWWDSVYDDATTVAKLLGVEFEYSGTRPSLHFSGFNSQGDGACFSGYYHAAADCNSRIKEHAPQDEKLHRIAAELTAIQCKLTHGTTLGATITMSGNYCHSGTMRATTSFDGYSTGESIEGIDAEVTKLMRDFADWIYKRLEEEHEHLTSDAYLKERFEEDEQEFLVDGTLC